MNAAWNDDFALGTLPSSRYLKPWFCRNVAWSYLLWFELGKSGILGNGEGLDDGKGFGGVGGKGFGEKAGDGEGLDNGKGLDEELGDSEELDGDELLPKDWGVAVNKDLIILHFFLRV